MPPSLLHAQRYRAWHVGVRLVKPWQLSRQLVCLFLVTLVAVFRLVADPATVLLGASPGTVMPNFSGIWLLERTENQREMLKALGINSVVARAAALTRVTQAIDHRGNEMTFNVKVMPRPPGTKPRRVRVSVGVAETPMLDDSGREVMLLKPEWRAGGVFAAGLRYMNPVQELTIERYMEGMRMVEHVRYPSKGIEMRRIFKQIA